MSYQTELSAIAIAIANSSFSNVAKLSRLVAIYGDKKEVKNCWAEVCENNGLSSSTSKDYWTLSIAFGFMFTDYQATRDLQVKQTEAKFSDLGVDSLKKMKTYKISASKLLGFESSLKTMRSSNGQDSKLENLIKLVTDSKGKTLSSLESNLAEVDSYLKAMADEAEKAEKLAAEKLAAEKLAAEKLAAEKLAAEKLAASDADEADEDEADEDEDADADADADEADEDEADEDEDADADADADEADEDEADEDEDADAPKIDDQQMAMLLATLDMLNFEQVKKVQAKLDTIYKILIAA